MKGSGEDAARGQRGAGVCVQQELLWKIDAQIPFMTHGHAQIPPPPRPRVHSECPPPPTPHTHT